MGPQIRRWSAESVGESQRLAYQTDSICDSFLEMKARPAARGSSDRSGKAIWRRWRSMKSWVRRKTCLAMQARSLAAEARTIST